MATLALGLWIKDKPVLGSIIRLKDIEVPRKDFEKYEEGEIVDMRCRGFKGIHKCLLGRIGGKFIFNLSSILTESTFFWFVHH